MSAIDGRSPLIRRVFKCLDLILVRELRDQHCDAVHDTPVPKCLRRCGHEVLSGNSLSRTYVSDLPHAKRKHPSRPRPFTTSMRYAAPSSTGVDVLAFGGSPRSAPRALPVSFITTNLRGDLFESGILRGSKGGGYLRWTSYSAFPCFALTYENREQARPFSFTLATSSFERCSLKVSATRVGPPTHNRRKS